jgi:hypothetical protein
MAGQYDVSSLHDFPLKMEGTLYLGLQYGRAVWRQSPPWPAAEEVVKQSSLPHPGLHLSKVQTCTLAFIKTHPWHKHFFVYFFSGLECVGHSFAYVAHLWFVWDVWIRTQSSAIASWRATDLATHPSYLATHPSNLATHTSHLATHPSDLATHPSNLATHPSNTCFLFSLKFLWRQTFKNLFNLSSVACGFLHI